MATHSSVLAWGIPGTGEAGGLSSGVTQSWTRLKRLSSSSRSSISLIYLSEKAMAPHSSTLAWKTPWMVESGRLQSTGSPRAGHDFTFTFAFHFSALEKEMATYSSVLAWRTPEMGEPGELPSRVTQSRTRLKRLSISSSNN